MSHLAVYSVVLLVVKTVSATNVHCCYRLQSLTLKRFVVNEALGLDKLTWLKLLRIDDSVTGPSVDVCLCYLCVV